MNIGQTSPGVRFRMLRKAEKLHRLAYELEADAASVRDGCGDRYASAIDSIASRLGDLARGMKEDLWQQQDAS